MKYLLAIGLAAGCLWAEKVEIIRDEFGVPHVYAETTAGAAYGAGYAQAQDRLEELLKNYRKAEGTMTEAFGQEYFRHDYRQRLWGHRRVAQENYSKLPAHIRALCEAFQKGVERYMSEHPQEVPKWAPKLEPWQQIALGRYIIWGWPEGEAGGDLLRGGIQPDDPAAYRGSNEMLIAPGRTSMHAPIAVVDPHLSWYGEFRFYEIRMYAKDFALSGASILGLPFPSLGHNRYTSIAMTTGGPDTSDIYEEEVRDGKYRFKDEWRPLAVRKENIAGKEVTIESTHHGPILAHKNGKAYTAAIPYANEYRLVEQSWQIANAHNLADVKKALSMLQLMAQNVMVGTVDGDIYYVRNGRVPIRPAGCDSSRPMSGADGACEWQGIHPFEDLVQVANPSQGYMQNCNVSPQWLMKDSPLTAERYAAHPYLYNAPPGPAHQRAQMTLEQLSQARNVTAEQAIGIAFSTEVYGAGDWLARIRKAVNEPSPFVRAILDWKHHSDPDSAGALDFYLFKMALGAPVSRAVKPPEDLTDAQITAALAKAEARRAAELPQDATFGTFFRVGREGGSKTWPAGGGSLGEAGMATPHAIGFQKRGNLMVGQSGQTSTQVVILTKPPQSYMILPLGESDHPASGHFDDQAEKLFSKGTPKSTYFLNRAELMKHKSSVTALEFLN